MTKIPFKPSINHFKTNPSLHHLLVHSKPYLLIYNTSQSILKWGRCVCFTKMTCFPDLLRVKWSHTWMYKLSWVQTTWVRKYTWQAFPTLQTTHETEFGSTRGGPAKFYLLSNSLERSSPGPWALKPKNPTLSAQAHGSERSTLIQISFLQSI
jgi:hypothetical protein